MPPINNLHAKNLIYPLIVEKYILIKLLRILHNKKSPLLLIRGFFHTTILKGEIAT